MSIDVTWAPAEEGGINRLMVCTATDTETGNSYQLTMMQMAYDNEIERNAVAASCVQMVIVLNNQDA